MQTFVISAYVTSYSNASAHARTGALLKACIRIPAQDFATLVVQTTLSLDALSRLSTDTMPSRFAIDIDDEGVITMRLLRAADIRPQQPSPSAAAAGGYRRQLALTPSPVAMRPKVLAPAIAYPEALAA